MRAEFNQPLRPHLRVDFDYAYTIEVREINTE